MKKFSTFAIAPIVGCLLMLEGVGARANEVKLLSAVAMRGGNQ